MEEQGEGPGREGLARYGGGAADVLSRLLLREGTEPEDPLSWLPAAIETKQFHICQTVPLGSCDPGGLVCSIPFF